MATAHSAAKAIYEYPCSLYDKQMRYCPGCTHGTAHRLVAEVVDELGIGDHTIAIASVGCSVYAYEYFDLDAVQAAHGRAPAVATGIKRVRPDNIVFTYQGDGDLAAIGMGELIHAASRSENITIVFINNAVFGMTQGQMAPTTLVGQKTTTTPLGRRADLAGPPIRVCELLQTLPGVSYLARATMTDPKHIREAKRCLRHAFETQIQGRGFSLVELLSTCPTWWGKSPLEAMQWLQDEMLPVYPLGTFRDWDGGEANA